MRLRAYSYCSRRDRDPDRVHAVVARRVQDHAAPTATDVEQPLAFAKIELATDQVVLGPLRTIERIVLVLEHRTRVGHRRAEEQFVERVGDVVVRGDRRGIARLAVQPAVEFHLFGRRIGWTQATQRPHVGYADRGRGVAQHRQAEVWPVEAIAQRDDREDVAFDVDLAGDVRTGEGQLVGTAGDDAVDAGRAVDANGGRRRRSDRRANRRSTRSRSEGLDRRGRRAVAANSLAHLRCRGPGPASVPL